MKIAIDASRANKDHKTGTEWYSYYVIEELKKISESDSNIQFVLYTNEKLKGDLSKLTKSNWQEKVLKWPPRYLWTQIRLWWELIINPPDVLFVPAHTIPFLPISKKTKVCVNVHDVGFKRFSELYKPIQVWYHDLTMQKIKNRADVIITISEFSKREIIELYGVDENKIEVVYLGFDQEKFNIKREVNLKVLEKYHIKIPYLLYLGRLEKKKNIGNMVAAFAQLKDEFPQLKLVLAGSAGNEYEAIEKIISDLRLQQEIILPGYIDQLDIVEVIRQAEVFLFPTLYEGFGLPILEAMACGTPVVTSDIDPHKEVAGGAAVLADPRNPVDLAAGIKTLLSDRHFRQDYISKGLERVKVFSWQKTGQDIYKILVK